jgi:phosphoribosylanthranilate isomerase
VSGVRVKICGCRSVADALAAAEAGADFVGLMFAASPRRVSVGEAGDIVRALGPTLRDLEQTQPPAVFRLPEPRPGSEDGAARLRAWYEHGASALDRLLERKRPLTVGVFAAMDPEEVNDIAEESGIDLVQFSGREPWGHCLLANRQVIKAVHVAPGETARAVLGRVEAGGAVAVLLDRGKGGAFGGTGEAIDWGLAAEVAAVMPVWLAGGLTAENVAGAIERVRPWCVDVSTGVETDGVKDYGKVRRFVAAARGSA